MYLVRRLRFLRDCTMDAIALEAQVVHTLHQFTAPDKLM